MSRADGVIYVRGAAGSAGSFAVLRFLPFPPLISRAGLINPE